MQEKRAVIHVDRADDCDIVVRYNALGMQEARAVFVNLDARTVQLLVIGAGDHIDQLFIRDARSQDAHIHPRLRRNGQRSDHFIVQHQVRRRDIDIVARIVDDL